MAMHSDVPGATGRPRPTGAGPLAPGASVDPEATTPLAAVPLVAAGGPHSPTRPPARRENRVANGLRGSLIGVAEALPGISGGTIALIVGVYERLIGAAGHLGAALRFAVTDLPAGRGPGRALEENRRADWGLLIPLAIGMVVGLLLSAKLLAPLVTDHGQYAYAVFFGLVLASLWIPFSGSGGRWKAREWLTAVVAAGLAFWLTSLSLGGAADNPLAVIGSGAIAVCALVLPGLSGSFLLLALGMYEPTIEAVNERDLGYVGIFATGAVIGLVCIVKLLRMLLERHHRVTLVVLTGLMAGSLRALWPWQGDEHDRSLYAPDEGVGLTVLLFLIGFALVTAVLVAGHRRTAAAEGRGRRRHARN
ncbi:DUF368 domain-containing protein [Streptomyces sp. ST2-7A]|uniref:DUF368 domain-containing protein n=1 Tax=Streptomyces sp. ST2-7A TaxID=2907214 RepID=UPI001F303641|nr:DUF368 domain-containing protein [Streptomyces sp. ST2-7A]MCE7083187.1 DUF368 domain-containing protein [Streptomyces sp. ST2-7A]